LKIQTAKLEEMKAEKFIIFNDLLEIYFQRKSIFDNIKTPITNTNKEILIEVYKNEGQLKDKRLRELAKQTKMTENDVKNWFKWFDLVVQYGKKNKALNDLVSKINTTEMEYRQNNYNYLVNPFTIKEFKTNLSKKKLDSKAKKITAASVVKEPAPAPAPAPVVKKIIKVVPTTAPQVIKKPAPTTPTPPVRKPVVLKKRVGGGISDLTGKTITIDPYSMSMT
jgi:DNA-binding protein H-NS